MIARFAAFLILGCAVLAPGAARADAPTPCPLIRPPGLSGAEVDAQVLRAYAGTLRRQPGQIDVKLTPAKVDGTENTVISLLFALLAVRDNLGVDVMPGLLALAKTRGGDKLEQLVTVAEIQAEARKVYAAGKDSAPPDATAGASYKLLGIRVATPRPAAGWRLVQCGSDAITFKNESTWHGMAIAAGARIATLPKWHDEARFKSDVGEMLEFVVPPDLKVSTRSVDLVQRTGRPCVDFAIVGTRAGLPHELHGRACYAYDNDNPNGYMSLVSFSGAVPSADQAAQGRAFIESASPK